MNIQEIGQKCKEILRNDAIFMPMLVILVGTTAFGLGRASVEPFSLPTGTHSAAAITTHIKASGTSSSSIDVAGQGGPQASDSALGMYVASKNGTRYHLPWCSGAQNIKEENKIWFDTKEEAEAAGYTPAQNCKGI